MAGVNVNALIAETGKKFREVGIESGPAEAELILCDLLDVDRLRLYLNGPSLIDETVLRKFNAVVKKRLTRYPLQYILGNAWFYGRKFLVNEDVMVPTPETELLLESILRAARFCESDPVRVLDMGVGSGVVAVSAKLENPELDITAVDISDDALHVAQVNAGRFEVADAIRFIRSDLFENIDSSEKFDIIASNPPYISTAEYDELEPEVLADPKMALVAGPRGLDIITRLIAQSPDYLTRPGILLFEIGYDQAEEVFSMVENDGRYIDCSLIRDLSDIDRLVICKVQ
jgi:release factor glutamine methyltransferase